MLERKLAAPLAEKYQLEVEPDYKALLEAAIEARFQTGLHVHQNYQSIYRDNLYGLPATNFEINSWSPAERSLLYFTLSVEDKAILQLKIQQQRPSAPEPNDEEEADTNLLVVTDLEKAPPGAGRNPLAPDHKSNGYGGGGSGGFGMGGDADKRALGLRAEKMVLLTLKGKVHQWMSGYSNDPSKNDRAGYDIRYKEEPEADWTYIEVKWFGSGLFRLPDTEFNFAKAHAAQYYIYLVTESQIRRVLFEDLLDENGEFTRHNDYFAYAVSEYKFRQLR